MHFTIVVAAVAVMLANVQLQSPTAQLAAVLYLKIIKIDFCNEIFSISLVFLIA